MGGLAALVPLDDPRARRAELVGAKASALARARAAGLPALPGWVVPSQEGQEAAERGAAALSDGDSGRARLAVMEHPLDPPLCSALDDVVRRLGGQVVVRSSSPLEKDPVWAGAFSTFDGVGVDEVATAVRGVWASAFTVDALERCAATGVTPGDQLLAVLVQPEVDASYGGSARWGSHDGRVDVVAVTGSPAGLLGGREHGLRASVPRAGPPTGEAVQACGPQVVAAVADLCRAVAATLGHDLVEWAWVDGAPVLLQARTAAPAATGLPAGRADPALAAAMAHPAAERVVGWVGRFPGPLAESVVLPWAVSTPVPDGIGSAVHSSHDPRGALDEATRLAGLLTADVWGATPPAERTRVLAEVRTDASTAALATLDALSPADGEVARRVVALLRDLAAGAAALGLVATADEVWRHDPGSLRSALDGVRLPARRVGGPDEWEPFVHDFLRCRGTDLGGSPAAPGASTGWSRAVRDLDAPRAESAGALPGRHVLVAPYPVPALASLLWSAAGLVTGPGDASAHLFEVASSLRVPAVVDADVDDLLDGPPDRLVAVDGTAGRAWVREV